jgi:hypothetical protein
MKVKTASILSILVGSLSLLSGMSVATGMREVDYIALPSLIVYNIIAAMAAIVAGFGLWQKRGWAVRLTAVIAGAHLVVLTLISFVYVQGGPVATESVYAMGFRLAVWVVIVRLTHQ